MPVPLLPPRGVFAATSLVFDLDLPPGLKETLLQLVALAWSSSSHETPPLSYAQLSQLTGKSNTTLHGHIALLRTYRSALRLRNAGQGVFIVSIANWLYPGRVHSPRPRPPKKATSRNPELPVKETIEEEEDPDFIDSPLPPPVNGQQNENPESGKAPELPPELPPELSLEIARTLSDAGIFSFMLPEVARAGWADKDLLALLAWCQADQPERPGGLFIARLRAGAVVPPRYYAERCDVCGQVDGHAPDCRRRYLDYLPH